MPWQTVYCYDRGAEWQRLELLSGGPPRLKQLLLHGRGAGQGLDALSPPHGWSHIHIPGTQLPSIGLGHFLCSFYRYYEAEICTILLLFRCPMHS